MPRHPLLADFVLDYSRLGPSEPFARSALGQTLIETLLLNDPVCAIIAIIDAAPKRPPLPALDRYLLPALGIRAADNDAKILQGRVVRQIAEHIGAVITRSNVPITVPCVCTYGSIYHWPDRELGQMNASGRRERLAETLSLTTT